MMLIEETSVPDTALPVDAFKAHLRLGSGFGQDDVQDGVVRSFLRAAIAAIEARTGKVLITRRFSWSLTFWRNRSAQRLPVGPVSRILRVALISSDGEQSDLPSDRYWLEEDSQRPALRSIGSTLPSIPNNGSVVIELEAGIGNAWSDLPADLQQAVMMLAAHYYEYRNDTALSEGCMPFGVSSLIERFKVTRIGFGALK